MRDIILPITCYQIKLGLYILLGVTSIPSLIFAGNNTILLVYGGVGSYIFIILGAVLLVMLWMEDKLPRFPIRCKCEDD